jgi:pyruvate kinase
LLLDDGLIALDGAGSRRLRKCARRCWWAARCPIARDSIASAAGFRVGGAVGQDRADIKLAAELGADYLAVSFAKSAADMDDARRLFRAAAGQGRSVAKIERAEAIDVLGEIIDASDAVMVARGDLGVEIGDAELPGLQKKIIREALIRNRVVITATQMLQSMVESPIPTAPKCWTWPTP